MRHITDKCLNLLKQWEGVEREPYKDTAGKWTVGVGHLILPEDHFDYPLSDADIDRLLKTDLWSRERVVEEKVKVPLNDNQFGALVSFQFNTDALSRDDPPGVLRVLNAGEYVSVPRELMKWVNVTVNGKKIKDQGLVNRRQKEIELWLSE